MNVFDLFQSSILSLNMDEGELTALPPATSWSVLNTSSIPDSLPLTLSTATWRKSLDTTPHFFVLWAAVLLSATSWNTLWWPKRQCCGIIKHLCPNFETDSNIPQSWAAKNPKPRQRQQTMEQAVSTIWMAPAKRKTQRGARVEGAARMTTRKIPPTFLEGETMLMGQLLCLLLVSDVYLFW